jgi:hypothetical protein
MKTETVSIYSFDELDDAGKERAISAYRNAGHDYFGMDDGIASLKEFAGHFGVKIKNYEIGTCSYSYVTHDAENRHFRGKRLAEFNRDNMPTGYFIDCILWITFYDVFKAGGDAKAAFEAAIDEGVRGIVADMEYQESDEYIAEMLSFNNYEFLESGEQW